MAEKSGRGADVGDDHALDRPGSTILRIRSSTLATSFSVILKARAAGRFDVDDELPGVGAGKKDKTQQGKQREAAREEQRESRQRKTGRRSNRADRLS